MQLQALDETIMSGRCHILTPQNEYLQTEEEDCPSSDALLSALCQVRCHPRDACNFIDM